MKNSYVIIKKMCVISILSALGFVLTSFISIPFSSGGYFNLGDIIIILSSISLGPLYGITVGILGSIMADLFLGYVAYMPFTFVAKTLLALISGIGFIKFKNSYLKYIFPIIGSICMALTYSFGYLILESPQAMLQAFFDLAQGISCYCIALGIYKIIKQIPYFKKLSISSY